MAGSGSGYWERDSWSEWTDSELTRWSSSGWQRGEQSPGTTWAGSQRGEQSPGTKWATSRDKWQKGWEESSYEADVRTAGWEQSSQEADADEYNETLGTQSRRLRPPKRVREYHREQTKRIIEEMLKERDGSVGDAEFKSPPPKVPRTLPKPPPVPPTLEQQRRALEAAEVRAVVSPASPPRSKAKSMPKVSSSNVGKASSSSGVESKAVMEIKETKQEEPNKKKSTAAPKKKANKVSVGVQTTVSVTGCDRETVDEMVDWVLGQCKELQDALDSGAHCTATKAYLEDLAKDWGHMEESPLRAYTEV